MLFAGCVNSSNSLRLIGRGGGPPLRGGRGGRGRGKLNLMHNINMNNHLLSLKMVEVNDQ